MKRLIITTSGPGAGHLLAARIAERCDIEPFEHRLVWGAVPSSADAEAFFEARVAMYDADAALRASWEPWERAHWATELGAQWRALLPKCAAFERVELWIDPEPNAQLLLVQLLSRFAAHADLLAKLVLVHAEAPLGEMGSDHPRTRNPTFTPLTDRAVELAVRAWDAFRQPSPEASCALLAEDLDALPYLRTALLEVLDELPAVGTALGAT